MLPFRLCPPRRGPLLKERPARPQPRRPRRGRCVVRHPARRNARPGFGRIRWHVARILLRLIEPTAGVRLSSRASPFRPPPPPPRAQLRRRMQIVFQDPNPRMTVETIAEPFRDHVSCVRPARATLRQCSLVGPRSSSLFASSFSVWPTPAHQHRARPRPAPAPPRPRRAGLTLARTFGSARRSSTCCATCNTSLAPHLSLHLPLHASGACSPTASPEMQRCCLVELPQSCPRATCTPASSSPPLPALRPPLTRGLAHRCLADSLQ